MTAQVDEDPKSFKGELLPYSSSLEYLDDAFQVLALMLRIAKARHKEEMKEAFNDERPWYDVYRTTKVAMDFLLWQYLHKGLLETFFQECCMVMFLNSWIGLVLNKICVLI